MADRVAIVIVSHSPKVAEGAADMVREMVGDEVRVAHCGGNPEGGLGTDVARIKAAIEQVYNPAGVAMLVDLGGAETNSEMAIELLARGLAGAGRDLQRADRRGRGHGRDRSGRRQLARQVRATAEELSPEERPMDIELSADADRTRRVPGAAVVRDPTGLHARPAVKLTKLAKQFEASVRVRAGGSGDWVNAKSPNRVMKLKARYGETLSFEAEGAGCRRRPSAPWCAGRAQLRWVRPGPRRSARGWRRRAGSRSGGSCCTAAGGRVAP